MDVLAGLHVPVHCVLASLSLTLCLMSRRTSEVITQQSWENELAWNEGAVPSQSPELARQQWPPLPLAVIIWRLISLAISSQVSSQTRRPAYT